MCFITKPVTIDFFMFIEKYREEALCLTGKYQASLQEIILGFENKENCDIEK